MKKYWIEAIKTDKWQHQIYFLSRWVSRAFSETLVLKNVYYVLKKYWPLDRFFCFSESGVIASSPGWLKV